MIYYTVTEITPDDYTCVLNFHHQGNAALYIVEHPNLDLEGPDRVDTDDIYFEDNDE